MDDHAKFETINKLLTLRYGLLASGASGSGFGLKPPTPAETKALEEKLRNINADRKKLYSRGLDDLLLQLKQEQEESDRVKTVLAAKKEAGQWFNQADMAPDIQWWVKASYWSLAEGVALCLDRDPNKVTKKQMDAAPKESEFVRKYHGLYELAERARQMNQLGYHNLPGFFLGWAERTGIEFPASLKAAVFKQGSQIADWKTEYDSLKTKYDDLVSELDKFPSTPPSPANTADNALTDDLHPKAKTSMLKLIAAMAVGGYGFNPRAGRSAIISEIDTDLRLLNLPLSDDSIRKWLTKACELIDWTTVSDEMNKKTAT